MIALGVGITIGAIALIVCLRLRKMAVWERESQITVIPVWTDDPINDRCEIFVSKESYADKEQFKLGAPVIGAREALENSSCSYNSENCSSESFSRSNYSVGE